MRTPDVFLTSVDFQGDAEATRQMAAYTAKLNQTLLDIYAHLQRVKIVTSTPSATEMEEFLSESDIVIVHNSTQTNRKVAYKYQGTVYVIDSA